ncbi:hypothetical protein DM02DRAFT_639317 [Periconia macrospinosa]|uniref:Uncharacterized protein n=1 Tax=Periconia macrospinosa TaxID=97972 RepID=A0A2V1E443_9PLEO|nr:hypothetical protein DM02DRAFT_639317 [Periconia macrospinosa]
MMVYRPTTDSEWGFLGIIMAQAMSGAALEIVVLWKYLGWVSPIVYQVPRSYSIIVNCGLAMFGLTYQAFLAFDALHVKNNVQVYSICICNVLLFVFNVMRYGQTEIVISGLRESRAQGTEPLVDLSVDFWKVVFPVLITSSVLVGACCVGLFAFAYKLHKEFAWAIYRHVSGSRQTRRRFLTYKVLIVLIKIEIYFFLAFVALYGVVRVHFTVPEFPLLVCLVPLELLQVALAIYFTKTENVLGAIVAIVLRLAEIAYLISRIIVVRSESIQKGLELGNEMLLFAGAALAFTSFICINSMVCISNFGYGLKPLLFKSSQDYLIDRKQI